MTKEKNNLEKIMSVSQDLFFYNDYSSVSMGDIAKAVNITKAALYYHFESKTDLFLKVLEINLVDFKFDMEKLINSSGFKKKTLEEKIKKIVNTYLNFVNSHNSVLNFFVKKIGSDNEKAFIFLDRARKEIIDLLRPLSEEIIEYKKNKEVTPHEMTLFLVGMMHPFILKAMKSNKKINISSNTIGNKICSILIK